MAWNIGYTSQLEMKATESTRVRSIPNDSIGKLDAFQQLDSVML